MQTDWAVGGGLEVSAQPEVLAQTEGGQGAAAAALSARGMGVGELDCEGRVVGVGFCFGVGGVD